MVQSRSYRCPSIPLMLPLLTNLTESESRKV
jgi:hypothetical protein